MWPISGHMQVCRGCVIDAAGDEFDQNCNQTAPSGSDHNSYTQDTPNSTKLAT